MGNCYLTNNPGEDFIFSIIQQIKLNKLLYHELYYWVEAKKKILSYQEAKRHIETSVEKEYLKEMGLSLLDKENKELLLFNEHDDFIKDKPYKSSLVFIIQNLFIRHYEFNCYHYLLSMLSLIDAPRLEKILYFFEICTKIKRNFTFFDFNSYLYSYLHQNLIIITNAVLENLTEQNERKSSIKLDLDYLLKRVYNKKNIFTFILNILHDFSLKKNFDQNVDNIYIMTKDDFIEIFADKDYLLDVRCLREYFLTIYRDFL